MVHGRPEGSRAVLHRRGREAGAPRPGLTDGERWTRDALTSLRARSFTPAAWISFLGSSFRRSFADLASRPAVAAQAGAIVAIGAVGWGIAAAFTLSALWGLAWWALVSLMLLTHVGMIEGPGGEARGGVGVPNTLTLVRAWLVPAPALLTGHPEAFAVVLGVALVTDAADGRIARATRRETRFGVQTDAAVDVALVLVASWAAEAAGWVPIWAALLVTARYALPPFLAALHYFARAAAPAADVYVSGRLPGLFVAVGLVASAAEPLRTAGVAMLVVGSLAGVATAGVSAARAWRRPRASPGSPLPPP